MSRSRNNLGKWPKTIGQLGTVSFVASSKTVQTFDNMQQKSSVSYTAHKLHMKSPQLELTGYDADEISFDMTLSAFTGAKPVKVYEKLIKMMKKGKVVSLVLGQNVIGMRWVITSVSRTFKHVFKDGGIVSLDVSVTIKEYN